LNYSLRKYTIIGAVSLALLVLLAGCAHEPKPSAIESAKGALDELRATVREQVKDPVKAAELTGLVDQIEQLTVEANSDLKAHETKIRALTVNYDATQEDFKAAFREFDAKKLNRQERVLAIDQQTKNLTTEAEWKAIAKAAAHADEAILRAVQGI
jgi:uncharacterized coiled-coil DUF342 family protein